MSDVPKKWVPSPALAAGVSFFFPGTAGRSEVDRVMGKRLRSGCWRVIGGCHRRTPCPAPIRLSSESA